MKYFIGFVGGMAIVIFNLIFFVCGVITGYAIFGRTVDKVHGNSPRYGTAYRVDYSSYNGKEN